MTTVNIQINKKTKTVKATMPNAIQSNTILLFTFNILCKKEQLHAIFKSIITKLALQL